MLSLWRPSPLATRLPPRRSAGAAEQPPRSTEIPPALSWRQSPASNSLKSAPLMPLSINQCDSVLSIETHAILALIATGSAAGAHHRVPERADAGDLDLTNVAVLEVFGGAFGAHPHDIAGIERQVL